MSSATLTMTWVIVATAPLSQSQKEVQMSSPSRSGPPRVGTLAAVWHAGCAYLLVDQSWPSSASIASVASAGVMLAYAGSGAFVFVVLGLGEKSPLEYVSPPVWSTTAARFAATFTGEYCAPGVSV